ncbi:MAG: phosphatidylglycerophosphatase A [Rhodospirillales bacterium]|nr:phosphatidylglycerophosphatase A [Rhodospirillales bacterium]MBO6786649.1 phosphatidylglycerophosphatase A [Rhodospirillales bacterium]
MTQRPPLTDIRILIATWFGTGYSPKAPGTVGSVFALPVGWLIAVEGGIVWLGLGVVIVSVIGVWAANAYMSQAGEHDPGPVVIDEVAGQWLAMLPLAAGLTWQAVLIAFVLFRLFDIWKPWPISWADKSISGGFGVMFDDILAGIAAAACLYGLSVTMPRLLGLG